MKNFPYTLCLVLLAPCLAPGLLKAQTWQQRLLAEDPQALAADAAAQGDAARGAILFYQPYLGCRKCHATGQGNNPLGPDLTKADKEVTGPFLVASVLHPSRQIRKGFETVTVVTTAGKTITGLLLQETPRHVTLHDAAEGGQRMMLARDKIDELVPGKNSLMPSGLVNQLASRQQFLDLIRYLIEIRQHGATRAQQLEPAPSLYASRQLPEYEQRIDHAGLIAAADDESFRRGAEIYERLCVNCHGTRERPGSLPTSLRFASGKFKSGHDPYTMYQTLTRGFGMMVPQLWMVPQQKYDVIHYIREAYLKRHNPTQFFQVDQRYLASLPAGDTRGPAPSQFLAWQQMDYGPNLVATYEIGKDGTNFAYKGNAIRLDAGPGGVSRGSAWIVYDYDTLRVAAAWTGDGFIDWNGINFNGKHAIHPRITGQVQLANPTGPGWANPVDGGFSSSFSDPRLRGRDGRPYGPLPHQWARYQGMYYHGSRVLIRYTVGRTQVLESPGLATLGEVPIIIRTLRVGPRAEKLVLQVAHRSRGRIQRRASREIVVFRPPADNPEKGHDGRATQGAPGGSSHPPWALIAGLSGDTSESSWHSTEEGDLRLQIAAGDQPLQLSIALGNVVQADEIDALLASLPALPEEPDLTVFTRGGPPRWPERLTASAEMGSSEGPFAVDVLTRPVNNPWFCRLRFSGLDFFPDGDRAAVCSWDGSVWLVRGLSQLAGAADAARRSVPLTWQRIASGLFQPLGLKIVGERIHVICRDQLCVLHDLNGDDEIDYYENLNNDHQVTDHFHEFAMGLQTDAAGNFYYAKSARHALPALVPHHGTLLRVSRDGRQTEILATGFRAANGVCLNPDGTFVVTDQEGHWNPKNRINWVRPGKFYGNMYGYHDVTDPSDRAMEKPLCWITNAFDRSPAELLWVDRGAWGPFQGSLLNLSYGYGKIYIVPHQRVGDQIQGGMCALPLPQLPTGIMRGRFHPGDGQLYVCGMFAWGGNQQQPGGLYRVRYTGRNAYLPLGLRATRSGIELDFSAELDGRTAGDPQSYAIKIWSLKRTANYGSDHYDERAIRVAAARLLENRRTVVLDIPRIQPTWCMEIRYSVRSADGQKVNGVIHNTIHRLE